MRCLDCACELRRSNSVRCAGCLLERKRTMNRERQRRLRGGESRQDAPRTGTPTPSLRCQLCRHRVPSPHTDTGVMCGIAQAGTCMPHVPWLGRLFERA